MENVFLGSTQTTVPKIGLGTARYFGGQGVLVKGLAAGPAADRHGGVVQRPGR